MVAAMVPVVKTAKIVEKGVINAGTVAAAIAMVTVKTAKRVERVAKTKSVINAGTVAAVAAAIAIVTVVALKPHKVFSTLHLDTM